MLAFLKVEPESLKLHAADIQYYTIDNESDFILLNENVVKFRVIDPSKENILMSDIIMSNYIGYTNFSDLNNENRIIPTRQPEKTLREGLTGVWYGKTSHE